MNASRANSRMNARTEVRGFTLVEVIIVLAVLAILLGTAMPMTNLFLDQGRRDTVMEELAEVSAALQAFYFDTGAFPTSLTVRDFYGVYLVPGIDDGVVNDGWGGGQYIYLLSSSPDEAIVRSRGPDGADNGGGGDDISATVPGSVPGGAKTRARMRIIIEVLGNFIESGGVLGGTWSVDRVNMGLGAPFATDGFGTDFSLDPATYVLRSAGPDRVMNTVDDLTS